MTPNRRNVAEAALAGLTTEQERRNEALIHQCEMLIAAIRAVVDNWGHGDLAAAVNISVTAERAVGGSLGGSFSFPHSATPFMPAPLSRLGGNTHGLDG
jgi:hypothetical protein